MRLLGDDQPVWAFQARGLDGLSMPHATVEDMAADYLAGMREVQPYGPYFIGSMCAGAWIAAVMARTLRAAGETVLPLLLLDPPNTVFQLGYAQIGEEGFVDKMLTRRARRGYVGPSDSPAYVQALITTAKAFEDAIARHRPQPYDGPVYVLSSRQRMQDPVALRKVFTGRFKRYHVGTNHSHALDPHNPAFAQTLLRCVGLIREAARAESSRRQAIR
jgi:thioesterase domain-containing protein